MRRKGSARDVRVRGVKKVLGALEMWSGRKMGLETPNVEECSGYVLNYLFIVVKKSIWLMCPREQM